MKKNLDIIQKALKIAARDLRTCYGKNGIYAGTRQFRDYWSWDSFFASLGALELGDFAIVKKNLRHFLAHQRADGLIPFRIGAYDFIKKYALNIVLKLKIKFEEQARYIDERNISNPLTSNSTLLIVARAYLEKTKDYFFVKRNFRKLKKALKWVISQDADKNLLLEEEPFSNWLDNIKKRGQILFSNVCHYKATLDFANICQLLREKKLNKKYLRLSEKIKKKIQEVFWNKKFFSDWIDLSGKRHDIFASDGNLLAVLWGVAKPAQVKLINEYMLRHRVSTLDYCRTSWPFYKKRMVTIFFWFINMINYQRKFLWSWINNIDILEKFVSGKKEFAQKKLLNFSQTIIKYNGIYEIYEETKKPVWRWLYKTEQPFAWSAGLFIYVCSKMGVEI